MKRTLTALLLFHCLFAIAQTKKVDLLVHHARIYTVDSTFTVAEAMAISDGKIVAVGKNEELQSTYTATHSIDVQGKYIFPGLIDAHAHFLEYGLGLQTADLVGTKSWTEIIQRLKKFASENPQGWLMGRGWDQNDWPVHEFPDNDSLNILFPGRPVALSRIDGHAAIANKTALDLAGVKAGDHISGGEIETKGTGSQMKLTGILVDNAVGLVGEKIPAPDLAKVTEAFMDAQRNCFEVGLTTIDDCGLNYDAVLLVDSLQKANQLKMRIYAMLSDNRANFEFLFKRGKIKTAHLNVRSFKVYADGALGSRGACLLQNYSDKPGWGGFLLSAQEHFDSVASLLAQKGYQMCTHAIGDSGNRTMLNIYGKYLKGKNNLRWRIEHAQVINENDFDLFGKYSVVASVQPTHATSDMYWAAERLGPERVKGAYAYKRLLKQNNWLPLGTDFPVEDISPFKTFYAAVVRKDAKGWPDKGFQIENALSRKEALMGMTIWAAKANFEEQEKGSLEKGKLADFVVLDTDLMQADEKSLLTTQVLKTFLGGELVFERKP